MLGGPEKPIDPGNPQRDEWSEIRRNPLLVRFAQKFGWDLKGTVYEAAVAFEKVISSLAKARENRFIVEKFTPDEQEFEGKLATLQVSLSENVSIFCLVLPFLPNPERVDQSAVKIFIIEGVVLADVHQKLISLKIMARPHMPPERFFVVCDQDLNFFFASSNRGGVMVALHSDFSADR